MKHLMLYLVEELDKRERELIQHRAQHRDRPEEVEWVEKELVRLRALRLSAKLYKEVWP